MVCAIPTNGVLSAMNTDAPPMLASIVLAESIACCRLVGFVVTTNSLICGFILARKSLITPSSGVAPVRSIFFRNF